MFLLVPADVLNTGGTAEGMSSASEAEKRGNGAVRVVSTACSDGVGTTDESAAGARNCARAESVVLGIAEALAGGARGDGGADVCVCVAEIEVLRSWPALELGEPGSCHSPAYQPWRHFH